MRIGIDARPLAAKSGGIRRYTERLIQGLGAIDSDNEYVLYGAPPGLELLNLKSNLVVDSARYPGKRYFDHVYLPRSNDNLDLFHGTNYMAPLVGRFPSVLTVHDLTVQLFPENHPRTRRLRHRVLPHLCRRAARIITDSHNTKKDLLRLFGIPASKVDVVYLAADASFNPVRDEGELDRVRIRLGLPESFALFVGTLEPRKNLPLLIRSMATLMKEGVTQRLVIAGEGNPRYVRSLLDVTRQQGLQVDSDVIFTGALDESDLAPLYSLCDLFVYPSIYEGFGLPPLEAMACGAPVLLPNHSSLAELYSECALLANFEPKDEFVAALRSMLSSPELLSEMSKKGLKHARSRSWQDTANETLHVYEQAVNGGVGEGRPTFATTVGIDSNKIQTEA